MKTMLCSALKRTASTSRIRSDLRKLGNANTRGTDSLAQSLNRLIQGVPAALDIVFYYGSKAESAKSVRFAAGQVFYYLLEESDLISSKTAGLVGIVDDAYLAHSFANRLMMRFGTGTDSAPPYRYPARDMQAARAIMPAGVAEALEATSASLIDVAATLFSNPLPQSAASRGRSGSMRLKAALEAIANEKGTGQRRVRPRR